MEDMNLQNVPETPVEESESFGQKCKAFFKDCWYRFTHMQRKTVVDIIVWILLAFGAVIVMLPFVWLVFATFKPHTEIYKGAIFPQKWQLDAYKEMWEDSNIPRGFLNSFLTTVPVVLVQVFVSAMAAYAFAKLDFKGKNALFLAMLSTMMVPFAVVMLPQAWLYGKMGFLDAGPIAVIVPKLFGSITTVFFLRQFLYGIPKSISEAALLDGANYTKIFVSIILPLVMPALSTQFILSFIGNWNDYLGPMLFIRTKDWYTLPIMIARLNQDAGGTRNIPRALAASLVSLIPVVIVFAIFQKKIIGSIVFSAVKG